jgi:hypothetical protein
MIGLECMAFIIIVIGAAVESNRLPFGVRPSARSAGNEQSPHRAGFVFTDGRLERRRLLVLDIERLGIQPEHIVRRQQRVPLLRVVMVKELEAGVLDRLGHHVILV